ncbi:MAG TPA: PilZ domain-containing protein [Dissulfurispiraceae bacterium]|nr:PilZ domain-containing protein [Dissulfurispiraceae bacterium]
MFREFFQKILRGGDDAPSHRQARMSYEGTTMFSTKDGLTFGCTIIDVSERGMQIKTGAPIQVGWTIRLHSPSCVAKVVWVKDGKAGLSFAKEKASAMSDSK